MDIFPTLPNRENSSFFVSLSTLFLLLFSHCLHTMVVMYAHDYLPAHLTRRKPLEFSQEDLIRLLPFPPPPPLVSLAHRFLVGETMIESEHSWASVLLKPLFLNVPCLQKDVFWMVNDSEMLYRTHHAFSLLFYGIIVVR